MEETILRELKKANIDLVPVFGDLHERGVLTSTSPESGLSATHSLSKILTAPRAEGLDKWDIFFVVLERLYNPATNTQIINVPFRNGKKKTNTCVSATRIFVLITKQPGEYTRIVEELTSPSLSFTVTRSYPDLAMFQSKTKWLEDRFPFQKVGPHTLRITVLPDANALQRAFVEQRNLRYSSYDFGKRDKKNSRTAVDVLLQSALTNYALGGQYDSYVDANVDGSEGVPFGSFGYLSLDQDILAQDTVFVRGPNVMDQDWVSSSSSISSPLDAPDAPDIDIP